MTNEPPQPLPDPSGKKFCRRCATEKPLDAFYKVKTGKLGRHTYCIECTKQYMNTRSKLKRTKIAIETGGLADIIDENGKKISPEDIVKTPELYLLTTSAVGQANALLHNRPESLDSEFRSKAIQSALVLAYRPTPKSCSCCRSLDGVEHRESYRICRRCAVSVDVCGRCVLHPSVLFRPELGNEPAPPLDVVLAALGELAISPPCKPAVLPEDDD